MWGGRERGGGRGEFSKQKEKGKTRKEGTLAAFGMVVRKIASWAKKTKKENLRCSRFISPSHLRMRVMRR